MNVFELIERASREEFVDEEGERVRIVPLPGLSLGDIATLESSLGFALPRELRELLPRCRGVEGVMEGLDFGGSGNFGMEEVFPRSLPLGQDGFGNYWILDVSSADTESAPVFFACHDPPVILYQADDLRTFLDDGFLVVDLRRPKVGMGFPCGGDVEVRRHGEARLFAYRRAPKRSFWKRLFG